MQPTNLINQMKHQAILIIFAAAAIAVAGCDKHRTTAQQLERVQEKTAAATQDIADYSYSQKDQFVAKMRTQLAELNK